MKSTLIFICGIFFLYSCQEQSKTKVNLDLVTNMNDTVALKTNLKNHIGKTVGELLENNAIKHYDNYYWSDEPPGKLNSLNLTYQNTINLKIYAYPLKFTPSFSKTGNFNFNLFKKEKVTKIIFEKDYKETIIK